MNDLDSILSGQGNAAPEQPILEENVTQATEGEGQQEQLEANQQEGETQERPSTVPHQALHAEKQKVKRYTEEVSSLRQEIAQRDQAWERRIAQLMEAQKPKAEPQQRPDWYENPEGATRHEVQQTVAPHLDHLSQTIMANAQLVAGLKYGDDKVSEAEQAFIKALESRSLDPSEYQKVVTSPNRYAAAVQWHQRHLAQAEIGDDPAAYKAKLEAELREKILAEQTQGNGGQSQQRPGVMPSNLAAARNVGQRSGPSWSGPAPLDDIFNRQRGAS